MLLLIVLSLFLALFWGAGQSRAEISVDAVLEPVSRSSADRAIRGNVDWQEGSLIVWGEGVAPDWVANPVQKRLLGFRAAKAAAFRNMLELIGEVRVDANTTVGLAMVESDVIRTQVEGVVQGARLLPESEKLVDGLYKVALRLDLNETLAPALVPDLGRRSDSSLPLVELPTSQELLYYVPPKPYTGLVIDARGLAVRPGMAPRILGLDGRQVYSASGVQSNYAARLGIVGYHKDIDKAVQSDRVGGTAARPLVVRAQGVTGHLKTDVELKVEDAVRVLMADAETGFLAQCRVVFVVGPAPAIEPVQFGPEALPSQVQVSPDSVLSVPSQDQ